YPAKFSNLVVIATSGYSEAGEVLGNGVVAMDLNAGTYVVNVLAQVDSSTNYGLYGLSVSPAPTAMLMASQSSVTSGNPVTLTWSSSDTTACSAAATPADGWTGTLATSGSMS